MNKLLCSDCREWHRAQRFELIPKDKDRYQLEVLFVMSCECGNLEMSRYYLAHNTMKTMEQKIHKEFHEEFIIRTRTDLAKKDEPEQREMRPKPIVGDATLLMCTPADQNIEKKEKMFRVTA